MESHSLPPPPPPAQPQTIELPTRLMNPKIEALLCKAIALQLKLLLKDSNAQFTKQSFDELLVLVKYQMNDLMKNLNKIMLLQRRLSVSNDDIEMWLQGYKLNLNDLFENIQLNQFLRKDRLGDHNLHLLSEDDNTQNNEQSSMSNMDKMLKEQLLINKNLNLTSNISPDSNNGNNNTNNNNNNTNNHNNQKIQTATTQSHLQNPIFNCSIKLPELPPDHTYKFTSQFNNFTTDERIIKQNLVDESKVTESTLLNYLNTIEHHQTDKEDRDTTTTTTTTTTTNNNNKSDYEDNVDEEEMLALFGTTSYPKPYVHHDFNSYYNKKSFNIAKYSHNRIDIARKRVKDFEINNIMNKKNPIFNLIFELRENGKKFEEWKHNNNNNNNNSNQTDRPLGQDFKIETSFNNKKINSLLKKDLNNFLASRTHLQKKKKQVIEKAIKDRDIRISQIRQELIEKEKREKEAKTLALLKNQQLANAAVLDKVRSTSPQILIPPIPSIVPTEIIVGNAGDDDDDDEMGLFGGLESSDEESTVHTATNTTIPMSQPHMGVTTSQALSEESKEGNYEESNIAVSNTLPNIVSHEDKLITNNTVNDLSLLSDATVPSSVDHTMTQAPVLLTQDDSPKQLENTYINVSTPTSVPTTQEVLVEAPSEVSSTPHIETSVNLNSPSSDN
ncbi:hypothetical protein MOSE0_L10704 [Monosporozyma servazzii]